MELRHYWKLFRRRWLLVVIPFFIVAAYSVATYTPAPPPGYSAGVTFIVSQSPSSATERAEEERYYTWLTSEYIVNGLTDWVTGTGFATAVREQLAVDGLNTPPGSFHIVADNVRSKLQLSISHADADVLENIVRKVILVLTEQNADALPQLGGETAVLVQLDQPVVAPIPQSIRNQLDTPLRILLGLAAGMGLALLAEYLDPTIRERSEVEALELTVLGEIPKK
jgi:capsular polysaccharide biosynthesis protein